MNRRAVRFLARLLIAVPLGMALAPSRGRAGPLHPDDRIHDRGRLLASLVARERLPEVPVDRPRDVAAAPPVDYVHAAHDVAVDPETGTTRASLSVRVRANGGGVARIGFVIDDGLAVLAAHATDRDVAVSDSSKPPVRVVEIALSPPLPAGAETTIDVTYAGTLGCGYPRAGGAAACATGGAFAYFAHQSFFPLLFDPAAPSTAILDALTREIVLRVPAAAEVVATGEAAGDTIEGPTRVSRWSIDRPLSRAVGLYAFAGKLGRMQVMGRAATTTLVFPTPEKPVDRSLVAWSEAALDFVEAMSGTVLPFQKTVSLVRLPEAMRDPGTATFGMTLLSDAYAAAGSLVYEETWAHENAHLVWGIAVPETNPGESRLMSEGMATLAEIDYSHARHFADEDRDLYLARRFLGIRLDLRAAALRGERVPPVWLAGRESVPETFRSEPYTRWAYYKTAATLDHLRVTVGEEAFSDALRGYVARCSFAGCRPDVLRELIEERTRTDLGPFFARWVTGDERPAVRIGFDGSDVLLEKDDDRPLALELWLALADGTTRKERASFSGRTARLDAGAPVLRASASPRHDLLVDVASVVAGDLDFDGEADGFDVLRCARHVGRRHDATTAGLWDLDDAFDPRCDVDGDLRIDEGDLEKLSASFGKLRAR